MAEAVLCYLQVVASKIMRSARSKHIAQRNSTLAAQVYTKLQVLFRVVSEILAKTSFIGHKVAANVGLWLESQSAEPAADEEDPNRRIKRSPREVAWRVASGAAHHMTGNQSLLLDGVHSPVHHGEVDAPLLSHLLIGGEAPPLRVRGIGSVRTEIIVLDDVWYVPGLDANLVSTGQLARQGCAVTLGPGGCRITRAGALVGSARFTEACHFQLDFLKLADP